MRPEVASVCATFFPACGTEGLTGAATCPNRSVIGPAGEGECVGPSADACEEVALVEADEVFGFNVSDVSRIDYPHRDRTNGDELLEPVRGVGIDLVVVVHGS